jgi:hypothetical protein
VVFENEGKPFFLKKKVGAIPFTKIGKTGKLGIQELSSTIGTQPHRRPKTTHREQPNTKAKEQTKHTPETTNSTATRSAFSRAQLDIQQSLLFSSSSTNGYGNQNIRE